MRFRSKRWQRDSTVTGTFRASVVAKMNFTCSGRLFQSLEQAVEGLLRQHMHLVDDVDLVARGVRLVVGAVDQVADVVDAGVGGRVHLDHVEMPALEDGAAMLALLNHVEGRRAVGRRAAT